MKAHLLTALISSYLLTDLACGQEDPYVPPVAAASSEARDTLSAVVVPEGFELSLFAAEPLLANPVAFAIDHQMRFFVAQTFRLNSGVTDMRSHMDWLPDELAARTVADRVDYMRRHEGENFARDYLVEQEQVVCLVDGNGDGQADSSVLFAGGFADPAAGVAAGILPVGEDVYFACIPDMWRLWDSDGDRVSDGRELQHTGWGVHTALAGHDMHGLVRGPDGRLYWSIGDRGFHVEHEGKTLAHHQAGAVLRSELDGSGLEIFATGLRNPQDLVFDAYGNLFTGDNNSDGGDKARWVYVVEGGDSGWRQAYQYIQDPVSRGPWNAELLWQPLHAGQPAYIVPPVTNFADGPSGIAYYPGTGWGPEYRGSFFLCDFRGDASFSGVHRFQLEQRGAGFALVGAEKFLWNCLPTDVQIGNDGVMYYSDWVHGWDKTGKGRLFAVNPVGSEHSEVREQVQSLLAEGMHGRTPRELGALLRHGHQTVRLEAQWELAARAREFPADGANDCLEVLIQAAQGQPSVSEEDQNGTGEFVRLHGLWGAGEVLRRGGESALQVWAQLASLHRDDDSRVRAQWMRVLSEAPRAQSSTAARRALSDVEPRVQFFASQCLANLGRAGHRVADVVPALLDLIDSVDQKDPWLRHAATRALAHQATGIELEALASDPRLAVRIAAVVALRRVADARVVRFLDDPDALVSNEAVRAIYDKPIAAGMDALAGLLPKLGSDDASLARRVLAAAWRVHTPDSAQAIGDWSRNCASDELGAEALALLVNWDEPNSIDSVMGEWRPVDRPGQVLSGAWVARLGSQALARQAFGPQRWTAWVKLSRSVDGGKNDDISALAQGVPEPGGAVQQAALLCALDGEHPNMKSILRMAAQSPNRGVRIIALRALAASEPERALKLLVAAYESAQAGGDVKDARLALKVMGESGAGGLEGYLLEWLEGLCATSGVGPLALELQRAAEKLSTPALDLALDRLRKAQARSDQVLADWVWALEGGDPDAGRMVFLGKIETECLRCHAFEDQGGSEVGPELTGVGSRLSALEILRSIKRPGETIAEGFEDWLVLLDDGQTLTGRIVAEDDGWLTLETPQKEILELELSEIEARKRGPSSMPEDVGDALTPVELRDLVAFLVGSRE